jgi:hypothetical protein
LDLDHSSNLVEENVSIDHITKQASAILRNDCDEVCTGLRVVLVAQS